MIHVTQHMTHDMWNFLFLLIYWSFGIGATIHTHQEIKCLLYVGYVFYHELMFLLTFIYFRPFVQKYTRMLGMVFSFLVYCKIFGKYKCLIKSLEWDLELLWEKLWSLTCCSLLCFSWCRSVSSVNYISCKEVKLGAL